MPRQRKQLGKACNVAAQPREGTFPRKDLTAGFIIGIRYFDGFKCFPRRQVVYFYYCGNTFLTIRVYFAKETSHANTRFAHVVVRQVYKLRRQEVRLLYHGPVNYWLILRRFYSALYTPTIYSGRYIREAARYLRTNRYRVTRHLVNVNVCAIGVLYSRNEIRKRCSPPCSDNGRVSRAWHVVRKYQT